jgi:CubicO group peptidase (beta-lactamase class C family)
MRSSNCAFALLLGVSLPVFAFSSEKLAPTDASVLQDDRGRKVDAVFRPWNRPDSPGCACAVIQAGKVIYAKGYGMADLEHNVPITPDSVFYIAFISKQFTAASVALLARDGKISLQDDIHKYFPELHDYGEPVTVDELIHHTSGIREYTDLLALTGRSFSDHIDNGSVIKLLSRQTSLNFTPGSRYLYTHSNYVLLAELVRRVSGQPLPEFAAKHIFGPLGMKDTQIGSNAPKTESNRALSYGRTYTGSASHAINSVDSSSENKVLSTVSDLARWDENLNTGKVGGIPFLKLILSRGALADGTPINYAFGVEDDAYRGLPTISVNGGYLGFGSEQLRFPDQQLSVVVLCNCPLDPIKLAQSVADIYLGKELAEKKEELFRTPPPSKITIDPKVLDTYLGRFALDDAPQSILTISRDGENLFTQAAGQAPNPIFPSSVTDFSTQDSSAQITFHREADGSVRRITLHQNGDQDGHRVDEASPLPVSSFAQYLGRYHSDELTVDFDVMIVDAHLFIRNRAQTALMASAALTARGADAFQAGHGSIMFRRDLHGQIDGLIYSWGRALNLLFTRESG